MNPSIARVATDQLSDEQLAEIVDLCNRAYRESLEDYLRMLGEGWHLLAYHDDRLVSHVMWLERALYVDGTPEPLTAAYVELVATCPDWQGNGLATSLLRRLAHEVRDFDVAALSPSATSLYRFLGWQAWRGALFVRRDEQTYATPDEEVMILKLPGTPAALNLDAALSVDWRPGEVW